MGRRFAACQEVTVSVRVEADADEPAILDLVEHTDRIADVANSLRLSNTGAHHRFVRDGAVVSVRWTRSS